MKILLYAAVLAAVLLVPTRSADVGELIPVEVVAISENRGTITVRTDTEDMGQGRTLVEAFEMLENTAPGVIYLDTAEYLLLEEGTEGYIDELKAYLKSNVRVGTADEGIEITEIADYLSVHKPDTRLDKVEDISRIPSISEENGRYMMREK